MSSFTFISFINKNDLKDEDEDVNFLIMNWWEVKWWEAFTRLIKISLKETSLFF